MTYQPNSDPSDKFKSLVKQWVQHHDTARNELADFVEASYSTIDKWWLGTVRPKESTVIQVIKWIESRLK